MELIKYLVSQSYGITQVLGESKLWIYSCTGWVKAMELHKYRVIYNYGITQVLGESKLCIYSSTRLVRTMDCLMYWVSQSYGITQVLGESKLWIYSSTGWARTHSASLTHLAPEDRLAFHVTVLCFPATVNRIFFCGEKKSISQTESIM